MGDAGWGDTQWWSEKGRARIGASCDRAVSELDFILVVYYLEVNSLDNYIFFVKEIIPRIWYNRLKSSYYKLYMVPDQASMSRQL